MRTKDEQLAALRDEMRGLLTEAIVIQRTIGQWQQDGRLITQQMRRANDLFERIVQVASGQVVGSEPEKPKPGVPNGTGQPQPQRK